MATTTRWVPFKDKMLVLVGTDADLRHEIHATEQSMDASSDYKTRRKHPGAWELENSMRYKPIDLLKASSDPLARVVRDAPLDAVALQNDGDELATGLALAHLRFCEPIAAPPYYMPATMCKGPRGFADNRGHSVSACCQASTLVGLLVVHCLPPLLCALPVRWPPKHRT